MSFYSQGWFLTLHEYGYHPRGPGGHNLDLNVQIDVGKKGLIDEKNFPKFVFSTSHLQLLKAFKISVSIR